MTAGGGQHRGLRIAANIAGLALLGAAVFVVYTSRAELGSAWDSARSAPAWLIVAVLTLPLVNWAITSVLFWTLMRRFGRVGLWEMSALIGSAWLLNMLPMKPGFVGRVAYHKAISGVPVRTTLLVTLMALVSGSLGVLLAVLGQIATDPVLRETVPPGKLVPIAIAFFVAALVPVGILWARRGSAAIGAHVGDVLIAILLRVVDTHVWALRYWLAFTLLGSEHPYGVCVVVSGVSQVAGQMPVQLGLREWSVGIATAVLGPGGGGGGGKAAAVPGLSADILGRVCEVVCALPVGLVSFVWIHRRMSRIRVAGANGASGGADGAGSGNSVPGPGV
jgi:hypothetical protein